MKNTIVKLTAAVIGGGLLLAGALPAFGAELGVKASLGLKASTSAKVQLDAALVSRLKGKANQEIERRINSLKKLLARVQDMARVSATVKTNLEASINTQVTALTELKTKINADTEAEALKTDVKSILNSYRIYALVIPQGRIIAAADRVHSIAQMISDLGVKLDTRIAAASSAGKDVSSMTSAEADLKAKIADANVQADAALSMITGLTPDYGDKTKMQANEAALKSAKEKINAAHSDLVKAHQDAKVVIQALKALKIDVEASSTVKH